MTNTATSDSSNTDHKASDNHDDTTAAIADNIEPIVEDEENKISLDGVGSASITSTSIDGEELDDNV